MLAGLAFPLHLSGVNAGRGVHIFRVHIQGSAGRTAGLLKVSDSLDLEALRNRLIENPIRDVKIAAAHLQTHGPDVTDLVRVRQKTVDAR